jgi:hypothetical protein
MRNRKLAFLCCAIVAAIGLLTAPVAMATGSSSTSCSAFTPNIVVVEGPCPVSDPGNPACSSQGQFTGIKYQNTGSYADHLATLVTRNNNVSVATGNQSYAACGGDPVTGLGKLSCHEKAVKVNPNSQTIAFWVVVDGSKEAIETSIVAKKGSCVQTKAITGLGLDAPAAPVTETLQHGQCAVEFTLNALTGTVVTAKLTPASVALGCESPDMTTDGILNGKPAEALELFLNGVSLGNTNFGQGYVNSGPASCTTRIVGGKVYTWGSPCP